MPRFKTLNQRSSEISLGLLQKNLFPAKHEAVNQKELTAHMLLELTRLFEHQNTNLLFNIEVVKLHLVVNKGHSNLGRTVFYLTMTIPLCQFPKFHAGSSLINSILMSILKLLLDQLIQLVIFVFRYDFSFLNSI